MNPERNQRKQQGRWHLWNDTQDWPPASRETHPHTHGYTYTCMSAHASTPCDEAVFSQTDDWGRLGVETW